MKINKIIIPIMTGALLFGCSATKEDNTAKGTQNSDNNTTADSADTSDSENSSTSNTEESSNTEETGIQLEKQYFNQVVEVDGKQVIQNVDNILIFVNKESAFLPDSYVPSDLVRPNVRFSFGDQDIEKSYMKQEAAEALEKMFTQAESEGIYLFAVSGYRSYERQSQIFDAEVSAKGEAAAIEAVAVPGQSEHQTGLSMDISAQSVGYDLVQSFETTAEGTWLAENAYKFGFILRYPKGKEDITGYKFEPWHYRYVGESAAKIIYENNWSLEEFFQQAKEI